MSKQIVDLKNRLYTSDKRATMEKQKKKRMEDEKMTLHLLHTSSKKFQSVITSEIKTVRETMAVVYEVMEKLHHTIAPIVAIQTHTKERVSMFKEAMTALDRIHEWCEKYLEAPAVVPRKYWIAMQNTRVKIRIKVQSKDKLDKYVERVMASYRQLFSSLESMIQLDR